MNTSVSHSPNPLVELTQDPRWVLARRVAESATFARSEQLPKLLLYICKMAILDRAEEINEQQIGVNVFGRSPDYDPAVDGIVRSHATRLRQRLEFYFSTEGAQETLLIEIPRGHYVPRFREVGRKEPSAPEMPDGAYTSTDSTEPPSTKPAIEQPVRRTRLKDLLLFAAGAAMASLALSSLYLMSSRPQRMQPPPDVKQSDIERKFWSTIFPPEARTLVVPGDSGLVLYETVSGKEVSLSDYIQGNYPKIKTTKVLSSTVSDQLAADLASRRYTSFVDLDLSAKFSQLPEWSSAHDSIVFVRDLRPSDAAKSNLVLIGSREANPWVSLVEPSMNFILTRDAHGVFYFLNRHPTPGESSAYYPSQGSGDLGASDVYGDVAYLHNPAGDGMVLSLSGLWMSGTQSSGNFVLDGPQFSKWLKSIVGPDGVIPPFELLIATKNLQGNAAYSSIIAKRVAVSSHN